MINLDQAGQEATRTQLRKMLAHPVFSTAPRLSSFLRFLVEETLAGRSDQLKEYTLGVAVFARGSAFDPRLDSIVRVEATKLRKRLETFYQIAGANDNLVIQLPRGSYVPRIASRPSEPDARQWRGAIAVLPFVYLGLEPDGEYLSDGLTEEIIDRLGTIPDMRVVARTSSFQFKGQAANTQDIGRTLGAAYLIEGSVRKTEDRLRVTARLIDAASGYRVWSHAYDKTPDDIFAIQIAIAEAIHGALSGQVPSSPEGAAPELPTGAYHLYLRGRFHRNQWTLEGFEKSIDYFERALKIEPQSAPVLAGLSEAETLRAIVGHIPATPPLRRACASAEQAIALDNRCAYGHLALGWIHHIHHWEWEAGQDEFARALEVNPSFAEAWHLKGLFLALRRRVTEADECFERAISFDPLSRVIQAHTALPPYFDGQFDEAESRALAALALDPNFGETHWMLGWIYERQERYSEALTKMERFSELSGESPITLSEIAFLHARLGDTRRARDILMRAEDGFPRPHPASISLARVYLALDDPARSIEWVEQAFEARDVMLPWACADLKHSGLWTLPAMSALRERVLGPAAR